jgi:ComF family protein
LLWQGPYHDPHLRLALYDWKYRGYWAVSDAWAVGLADRLRRFSFASPDQNLLVPIPLHWLRQLGRGYNQAAVLANQISLETGWPSANLLFRIRRTETQATLPDNKRQANVLGAFALAKRRPLNTKPVWLVDDIVTTGATIEAARQTLIAAGYEVAGVIVIANARRQPRDQEK